MESSALLASFNRLVEVVQELREKCPWDRKQTYESLRHLTIEETYELAETILEKDYEEMRIELGDLLLHIIFYSIIGSERKHFDLNEVIIAQTEKLIRRHPHIYGDITAKTEKEVKQNWEQIKAKEKEELAKQGKLKPKSTLDGVPKSLPPLVQAYRIQEKAANVGFDWENKEQVWDKVKEEIYEFQAAENKEEREEEMGDILFSLVNYCRFANINPDDALSRTNLKFKSRFLEVEKEAASLGRSLSEMSLEEMEALWEKAKKG